MVESFVFVGNTDVGSAFADKLVEAGFVAAQMMEEADAILVYCESQTDLEDVFFDSDGLIQSARKGSFLIDLSASTPDFARELNAVSIVSDLHAIEAPIVIHDLVSEDAFSVAANLSCFIAGEPDDIDAVSPMLSAIIGTVHPTGMAGTAQLARAAYSIQSASNLVAVMETDALYRAFSGSSESAVAFAYTNELITDQAVCLLSAVKAERFTGAYTVQMWMGELTAALMAADDVDLILPGAEACMHLLELLAVIGGTDMSPAALSLVYGEESQCAEHGLDWTRAEQAYGDDVESHFDDDDFVDHHHDEFSGGFGTYSSN